MSQILGCNQVQEVEGLVQGNAVIRIEEEVRNAGLREVVAGQGEGGLVLSICTRKCVMIDSTTPAILAHLSQKQPSWTTTYLPAPSVTHALSCRE